MKTKNIKQWAILDCTPTEAYKAWLDSKIHGEMINAGVKIEPKVGGKFAIWDGEIVGETLELHPDKHRIVQSWRYSNWPKDYLSKITIEFVPHGAAKCKLRFWHSGIPLEFSDEITSGWKEYYWEPMKVYFRAVK